MTEQAVVTVRKRVSAAQVEEVLSTGVRVRVGKWIWVLLLGADVVYEAVAFIDGAGGYPTLSQLVKRARRAGGIAGAIGLTAAILGAAVVLFFHWVLETPF